MNLEFFNLGGYGQFVWPAFIFTFVCCATLYIKTKKELQKQEKIFLKEHTEPNLYKPKLTEEKKVTKEVLANSSI